MFKKFKHALEENKEKLWRSCLNIAEIFTTWIFGNEGDLGLVL